MTYLEMQREFERLLVTMNPEFKDKEKPDSDTVGHFLTMAQNRYLKDTYLEGGVQAVIQKKVNEIQNIVARETVSPTQIVSADNSPYGSDAADTANAYYYALSGLSSTFMFYVRSDSLVTISADLSDYTCSDKWTPNKFIDYSDIDNVLTSPYNQPILIKPRTFLEQNNGDRLIVVTDKYTTINTTNGLSLTYIKEPQDISILNQTSCELPVHIHEPIVKLSVDMYVLEYKYRLYQKQPQTEQ
jgi:hypothetical protein